MSTFLRPWWSVFLRAIILLSAPGTHGGHQVATVFEAIDHQRLSVFADSTPGQALSRLQLIAIEPGGRELVLLTTGIHGGTISSLRLQGEVALENMVEGTYRFFIRESVDYGPPPPLTTVVIDHPVVYETRRGKRISGVLNRDEVIEGIDGLVMDVPIVPAGRTLTLRKCSSLNAGRIETIGGLVVEDWSGPIHVTSSSSPGRLAVTRAAFPAFTCANLEVADLSECSFGGSSSLSGEALVASFTNCTVNGSFLVNSVKSATWSRVRGPGLFQFRDVAEAVFTDGELELLAIGPGSLTLARCTARSLECVDLDAVNLEGSHVPGNLTLGAALTTGGIRRIEIHDSLLTGSRKFVQPIQSCRIEASDFYGGGLELIAGAADSRLEGNMFETTLVIRRATANPSYPTVRDNSFLGPVTVLIVDAQGKAVNDPIGFSAAWNYWGSARGPAGATEARLGGWLDGYGSPCRYASATNFNPTGVSPASSQPRGVRPLPSVWIREQHVGQNVLGRFLGTGAPNRRGRDTLACYDVKTSAETLTGLKFWLVCDGDRARPIEPLDPAFVVRRDYGPPIAAPANHNWRRTLNFIIPAERTRTPTLSVELWMDNSALTGFAETGRPQRLGETQTLTLDPAPARPLVIGVIGTQVNVGGYKQTIDAGADLRTAARLQEMIPAVWPLTTNDVRIVRDLGSYVYDGENTVGWLFSRTASVGLQTYLAWGLSRFLDEYNASAPQRLDFLVAVVPAGSLSGAYGVNTARWPRICLVDERAEWAALHELGHGLGLYVGTEQYDLPDGPDGLGNLIENGPGADFGAQLQNLTAFAPDANVRFGELLRQRLGHFPSGVDAAMHDFMGNNSRHWIVPSSLEQVSTALRALLGTAPSANALAGAGAGAATRGRRLFCSGLLQHGLISQFKTRGYRLVPESLSCRATTDEIRAPINNTYTDLLGTFIAYDALGDMASMQTIRHSVGVLNPPEFAFWTQTFELPGDAVRYELKNTFTGEILYSQGVSEAELTGTLIGPAPGTVLEPSLALQWSASAIGLPAGSLRNQLYYSIDGQNSWVPLGSELRSPQVLLSSLGLPASTQFALKLVTSDGFQVLSRTLDGLTVPDRAPLVTLRSPPPDATGTPEADWPLAAEAVDPEDGLLLTGQWTSSRDGPLGTGASLDGVRLSPGRHVLTFSTRDSRAQEGRASVTVTVDPNPATDLHLDPGDLEISTSGADPSLEASDHPQLGRDQVLRVAVQNQGQPGRVRVTLQATEPGAAERPVGERVLELGPFGRAWAPFSYRPTTPGRHLFRARLEALDAVDPVPGNDVRTWTFENLAPVAAGGRFVVYSATPAVLALGAHDADNDPLTWALVEPPAHGQLTRTGSNWTYVSAAYTGTDRFRFQVNDGLHDSAPATVELEVVRPPTWLSLPTITSYLSPVAIVGIPFRYEITAEHSPTNFEATGLPGGLGLDAPRGLLAGTPSVSGTFQVRLTAKNAAGSATTLVRLLVRTNSPANQYAAWTGNHGLTGSPSGRTADPDADGIPNVLEFALGLSPVAPGPVGEAVGPAFTDGLLTLTYRQRAGGGGDVGQSYLADGLVYRVEYSPDLTPGSWTSGPGLLAVVLGSRVTLGDGLEQVTVRLDPAAATGAAGYLRLLISDTVKP